MKSRQVSGGRDDTGLHKTDSVVPDEVLKYNVRFIFELLHRKMKLGSDKLNIRIKQAIANCCTNSIRHLSNRTIELDTFIKMRIASPHRQQVIYFFCVNFGNS